MNDGEGGGAPAPPPSECPNWVSYLDRSTWSPELRSRVELAERRMVKAVERRQAEAGGGNDRQEDEDLALVEHQEAELGELLSQKHGARVMAHYHRLCDVAREGITEIRRLRESGMAEGEWPSIRGEP